MANVSTSSQKTQFDSDDMSLRIPSDISALSHTSPGIADLTISKLFGPKLDDLLSIITFAYENESQALLSYVKKSEVVWKEKASGRDYVVCDQSFPNRFFMVNRKGEIIIVFADPANRKGDPGIYFHAQLALNLARPKLYIGKMLNNDFTEPCESQTEEAIYRELNHSRGVIHLKASAQVTLKKIDGCFFNHLFILPLMDWGTYDKYQNLNAGLSYAMLLDLFNALAELHRKLIIHRDIKISNIFVKLSRKTRRVALKIGDFNLAAKLPFRKVALKGIPGTPLYFSPEICLMYYSKWPYENYCSIVTPKADVWSMGISVHEMVFGEHLFGYLNGPNSNIYSFTMSVSDLMPGWYDKRIDNAQSIDPHIILMIKKMLNVSQHERIDSEQLLDLFWKNPRIAHLKNDPHREIKLSEMWIVPPKE